MQHEIPENQKESRQELKERMQKTQFTFGNSKDQKGMSEAKSLYTSGIDAQAKLGGMPASRANLKQ